MRFNEEFIPREVVRDIICQQERHNDEKPHKQWIQLKGKKNPKTNWKSEMWLGLKGNNESEIHYAV